MRGLLLALVPLSLVAMPLPVRAQSPQDGPETDDERGPGPEGQEQGAAAGEEQAPSEPGAAPENAEAARRAREHFRRGMEHFEKRAFREAIREFKLAADIVPSADLWFNIARAHEELSEYEQAVEHYQRYLRDRVDPPDREEVEQHIEDLKQRAEELREARRRRPKTGTLRVQSTVEGSRIAVDDAKVGEAPLAVPLDLGPGKHRLEVDEEGYIPFRSQVRIERGVTTGAYAELERRTEYESVRGTRVWSWIVGGLGAAALVTSIGLGAKARAVQNDGDLGEARDWALRSDYVLGAALGLGTVAAILWFVEGRAVGTEKTSQ